MIFWHVYKWIACLAILSQIVFLWYSWRNYAYVLNKAFRKRTGFRPSTLLTVPCKGIDHAFDRNIASIYGLDYENFTLHFVVEDACDPAYERLCRLKEKFCSLSKARDIRIIIAGGTAACSQKIHNLLYSCRLAPAETEIFAFADSDACLRSDWLSHIVYPLRQDKTGAATGYRWFVPEQNNSATLVLSALNATIAQLLGNSIFNQAWGGSMAVRVETFHRIGMEKIWQKSVSDDLSLSYAVKKDRKKIAFVPACLVASYEKTTWKGLFEFARRQFLITRITTPATWWFGLFGSIYSLAGLWATLAVAVFAWINGVYLLPLYAFVPALFLGSQIFRAALRQRMIIKLLPDDKEGLKPAALADILGTCLWSWLLFICIISSAFGRTIRWRGIRYRLLGPTETIILNGSASK